MEKFWAVILIFVVVAAAGLMYVNQVYNPQKETQMAMADMVNDTLTAVKVEIGDGETYKDILGSAVLDYLDNYMDYINGDTQIYVGSNKCNSIGEISGQVENNIYYDIEIEMENGKVTKIIISEAQQQGA